MTMILTLALVGCSTTKQAVVLPGSATNSIGGPDNVSPASGKALAKAKNTVDIPADDLVPCDDIADMTIGNPSGNDVLDQKAKDNSLYYACSQKNRNLIRIIKDAFNIK